MGARHFTELEAWQLAAQLSDRVVALSATPALKADLEFRDQMRNAAESAPRLIAEGFGRWSHRDFARYLVMARSELMELQSDLLALGRRRTITQELATELYELSEHTLKKVNALRASL
jgi:four helix bundle protein